ncbi:MAG TPA: TIGR03936 family radical SAM-associated protein [Anaerolineae bacterium]|nr:TIGR03936 family radical SAM-associated protein [Anaerolineae bacterium]
MSTEEGVVTLPPSVVTRQRLRITFARGENTRYVGHLDMVRTWERIIRRADLPIAYSEGFNPRPRLMFAAALPVGCTSDQEVLDVILSHPCDLAHVRAQLDRAAPAGIDVVDVAEAPYSAPALQTQTRAAEFVITPVEAAPVEQLRSRVQALLDAPSIERTRRDKTYDLRPLLLDMWVENDAEGRARIGMKLKAEESGTGRPDEAAAALGFDSALVKIHRRRLILA